MSFDYIEPQFPSLNILIGFWISTTILVTKVLKFSGITWLFSAGWPFNLHCPATAPASNIHWWWCLLNSIIMPVLFSYIKFLACSLQDSQQNLTITFHDWKGKNKHLKSWCAKKDSIFCAFVVLQYQANFQFNWLLLGWAIIENTKDLWLFKVAKCSEVEIFVTKSW